MVFSAVLQGVVLGAGMIIPIGAQNAYLLGLGINRNHHILAATICFFCDIFLVIAGVFGANALMNRYEHLMAIITWGGVAFLFTYGLLSFKSVLKNNYEKVNNKSTLKNKKVVILTTLAVTLLNPHVYVDTFMILGSVGSQFDDSARSSFVFGIIIASLLWFYGLVTGAAKMGNILSQPKVMRAIDFVVGCIMWFIAFSLYLHTTSL